MKLSGETLKELGKQALFGLSLLKEDSEFIGRILDDNLVEYLENDQGLLMYICPDDEEKELYLFIQTYGLRGEVAKIPLTKLLCASLDANDIAEMYEYDANIIEEKRFLFKRLFLQLISNMDKAHNKAKTLKRR